jgi:hypothetical protein
MGCHTWFYRNKEYLNKQLDCEFHDLFRAGYDEDKVLTSLEETLSYIKENNCKTFEYTEKGLKEFFNKYPDGVIEFG